MSEATDQNIVDVKEGNDQTVDNGKEGNAGESPAWMGQLPDDLKGNESLTKYPTIGELGKAFLDLQGKSEGAIKVPGEGATDEDRAAFAKALGVPESPEGYEITRPEQFPEGLQANEEMETWYKGIAHKYGLTPAQLQGLYQDYIGMEGQLVAKQREARAEAEKKTKEYHDKTKAELQKEWGTDFKANTENALRVAEGFAGEGFDKFFEQTKLADGTVLGDHPVFLRMFHGIFKVIGPDSIPGGPAPTATTDKRAADVIYPQK